MCWEGGGVHVQLYHIMSLIIRVMGFLLLIHYSEVYIHTHFISADMHQMFFLISVIIVNAYWSD